MEAMVTFAYEFDQSPDAEELGTIQVYTSFIKSICMDNTIRDPNFTFSARINDFIEVRDCPYKNRLHDFLREAGVSDDDNLLLIRKLILLAKLLTYSDEYSPQHALLIWMTFNIVYDPHEIEIQQATQISSMEIDFKPASKLAIDALKRKTYKKKAVDVCIICLDDFKGKQRILSLPCGHDFHGNCIVEWLKTSHICPLCRFELPKRDELVYIKTM